MRPNCLRTLLDAGSPSVGAYMLVYWPAVVEIAGRVGCIDYDEFVAEYAPYDLYALENLGRAVEPFNSMTAMIKVEQEPRGFIASRAIGSGIQNVPFADCRSAADVEECVATVRAETPATGGRHGSADRRFAGYIFESGTPEYVQALEDVVIAIMIEKEEAVDLDAILDLKDIDMVQFGPNDYLLSIGKPGAGSSQADQDVQEEIIKNSLAKGVQPRAEIGTPADAERFLDLGVRHFSIGTDLAILHL